MNFSHKISEKKISNRKKLEGVYLKMYIMPNWSTSIPYKIVEDNKNHRNIVMN